MFLKRRLWLQVTVFAQGHPGRKWWKLDLNPTSHPEVDSSTNAGEAPAWSALITLMKLTSPQTPLVPAAFSLEIPLPAASARLQPCGCPGAGLTVFPAPGLSWVLSECMLKEWMDSFLGRTFPQKIPVNMQMCCWAEVPRICFSVPSQRAAF